jgi:hypothetical protein
MDQDRQGTEPEADGPVEFYPPVPVAPLLGPVGIVLALATFFYFFL